MTELEWLDIFGDNLRSLIEEAGMTQKELSIKTGLSNSTISDYINKQKIPGAKAILNLSYALNCDINELIDFGEPID